ncbi:DEKNAAC100950 [Brettanomyces naardenensis]|uniref:DEKNAAC100950 n=1 Tax=Brettanomyces naardenensis TaxID=13370 RepID=A0A448YH41_BRENA|nr:DEKNAAC100950 [Brettanomyces naardenensis]
MTPHAPKRKQRKRNRVPISCTICRRRKVKCDKKKPQCTNCVKNGVAHLCRYLEPTWAKPLEQEELSIPGATVANYSDKLQYENAKLKERIKELERSVVAKSEVTEEQSSSARVQPGNQSNGAANNIPKPHAAAALPEDLLDCISNSNILFTAKKGQNYHFPILYQISVLSWMFAVRNDSYLNDLWLKILRLRKHYEYYYSSKNAMVDASRNLAADYNNYGNKLDRVRSQRDLNVISQEKTNEHTSKLKKFLDGTLQPGQSKENPLETLPPIVPNSRVSYSDVTEEADEIDDPKIFPLMLGDARALFKEKLSRLNVSAMRDTLGTRPNSPSATPPTVPGSPLPSRKRPRDEPTARPLKPSLSPSSVKHLNYNNTEEVLSVIEKQLPSREVIWLLIDRFFDKLYIHLPYLDEEVFRARVATIIGSEETNIKTEPGENVDTVKADPKAKKSPTSLPSSIGSQYCEEFLYLCLMLIVIRLSWLSLPNKVTPNLTPGELLLMRPENFVTMALVDMVKEVFSSAKIMSKPSLIIFQVGLFLKFYNEFSPEDGFDLDDSFTSNVNTSGSSLNSSDLSGDLTNESPNMNSPNFTAMLVQLARTIGLNRDPLNFKNFYSSSSDPVTNSKLFRKRHLWRKLWYGLLYLTIESNLSLSDYKKGLPIELDLDPTLGSVNRTWDCRLPGGVEQGVLEKSFGGSSLEKEQIVVSNFRDSIPVYHLLYKAMSALFTIGSPPTTKSLGRVMNKLLDMISEKSKLGISFAGVGTEAETMAGTESGNGASGKNTIRGTILLSSSSSSSLSSFAASVRIYKLRLYLVVKSLLFALNYLLFLNHEQKFNRLIADKSSTMAKINKQKEYIDTYFEGSLLLAVDNFNIFIQLIDNYGKVFPNRGAEFITYPFLLVLNHRSHEFLISLILRLQQGSPVVLEILEKNGIDREELLDRLFRYLGTFLDKLEGLTGSYYYAWRLKKMARFFYNILANSKKLFSEKPEASSLSQVRPIRPKRVRSNLVPSQPDAFEIAFGTSKLPPVTDYTELSNGTYELYERDVAGTFKQPGMTNIQLQQMPTNPIPPAANSLFNDDFFSDNFFSDLNEMSMGLSNDALDGLPYIPDGGLGNNDSSPGNVLNARNAMLGGNGFVGSAYNSLNEIDYTNVDLNAQLDDSNSNTNSNGGGFPEGHLGLGGLNLRFSDEL